MAHKLILLVALCSSLCGCGSSGDTVNLPPADTQQTIAVDEVSLSIPKSWQFVDLTHKDAAAKLKEMQKNSPEGAESLQSIAAEVGSETTRGFALGPFEKEAAFSDNFRMTREKLPRAIHINDYIKTVESMMAPMVALGTAVKWEKVDIAGHEGVIFRTSLLLTKNDVQTNIFSWAFAVRKDDLIYTGTFSLAGSKKDVAESLGQAAIRSFRFTK